MTTDIDFAFELGRAKTLVSKLRKHENELMNQAADQIEIFRNAIIFLLEENRELLNEVMDYGQ